MSDEKKFEVIEGGGQTTQQFAPDTRTSIQKRIAPKVGDIKGLVKQVIESEFGAAGHLTLGNKDHERRFARALYTEVGRVLFEQGIRLSNIERGASELHRGCLRRDLIAEGILKVEAPAPWAVESSEPDPMSPFEPDELDGDGSCDD